MEAAERSADWKEDWESAAEEWSQRRAEFQEQLAQKRERLEDELAQKREQMEDELRQHAAFPKMRSTSHRQAMEQLRRRMERRTSSTRK